MSDMEHALSRESVRAALDVWHDSKALGEHVLARLRIVDMRRRAKDRRDIAEGRGLSLREVMREAIEELRAGPGAASYSEKDWRRYIIVTEEFVEGRSAAYIRDRLGVAPRTYQLERAAAIDRLAEALRQWEDETRDLPTVEVPGAVFLAPPRPPQRLVGRYHTLQQLKERLFAGDSVALYALSGLPGVGKTALAVEFAHDPEVRARFDDGVLWAGLGQEPNVLSLLAKWAFALGIGSEVAKLGTVEKRADAVHAFIGTRHMLLVIDDAWQLGPALAFRVGGPNCAHLLTTRSPEIAQDFAEAGAIKVQELSDAAGLTLFGQLAPAVVEQQPDDSQELVRAVGGLPLAIILMARFIRREAPKGSQFVYDALKRLRQAEERLRLEQPQAPLERQMSLPSGALLSLSAAIELSEQALDPPSQRIFRALSVFPPKPNSFSEEAARSVGMTDDAALQLVLDAGLLEPSGAGRFMMHQTIADYARLRPGDMPAQERMVEFYVSYVEAHERDFDAIDLERRNILAALDLAQGRAMHESVVRGTNALYSYLQTRGLTSLAETRLREAQEAAIASHDSHGLTTILRKLGEVLRTRGDLAASERHFEESLSLSRETGSLVDSSGALQGLGVLAQGRGDYAKARGFFEEALALSRKVRDERRTAQLLVLLGQIATNENDHATAERHFAEALLLAREAGSDEIVSTVLQNSAVVAMRLGRPDQAEEHFREGLALARRLGYRDAVSAHLQSLGVMASRRREFAQALEYYEESLSLARETSNRASECLLYINLGVLEGERGNYARAEDHYRKALALARELGHRERIGIALANLGDLATKRGDYPQAEKYYADGLGMAREIGHHWMESALLVEWAESLLKQQRWTEAEATFGEGLRRARESGLQEYAAKSLYGLAQTALAKGDIASARAQAEESLSIFEGIAHKDAVTVRDWLASLPAAE